MAEELLVDSRIDDGQRLIDQLLADGFEITGAFWAKEDEGRWSLYFASPAFNDKKPGESFPAVYDSLSKVPGSTIELGLDIRLVNDRNPIAQDAIKIAGHPSPKDPIRYRGTRLGTLPIEDAYIYPRPAIPLRQAFTIFYVRQGESNEWSATTRKEELHRGLRLKGFVSSAHGPGDKMEDHKFVTIHVWVEVTPSLDERTIAANPVIQRTLVDQAQSLADEVLRKDYPGATIHHHDMALAPT